MADSEPAQHPQASESPRPHRASQESRERLAGRAAPPHPETRRAPGVGPSGRAAPRPHPEPSLDDVRVNSLNDAVRRELWYLDSMVAAPFRLARRYTTRSPAASPLRAGADEFLWAAEGMARLPVKVLQAAFGEGLAPARGKESGPA